MSVRGRVALGDRRAERRPPGPTGWRTVAAQIDMVRDQVGAFHRLRGRYGPTVHMALGGWHVFMVCEPEGIKQALVERPDAFCKDPFTYQLQSLVGAGLITSDGDFWRHQRKLVAPAFQRRRILDYAHIAVDETERMVGHWPDGDVRDVERDLARLTLRVLVRSLFGLEPGDEIARVVEAFEDAKRWFEKRIHSAWRLLPDSFPKPFGRELDRALEELDRTIRELIARRRRAAPGPDLLYRLVRAADDDDHPLTTEQLRDQVLTFLLAGHETTGLALTWALHLVNHDPEVLECVQADIGGQLGDRRAGAEDVEALERTRAVLLEAMRLYPPLWAMGRQAEREMELLGWKVPRGALVVMPQVVVHRDPRWFAEPESFRPWRWLGRDGRALPDFAYFPFGGGPRTCIGNHFALMEATLVLATLLQHVVPTARSPEAVGVRPAMTLHPKEPIRVQVNKRA